MAGKIISIIMIIGITGLSASGKDTVADYLKQKGFAYFSLSNIVREFCREKGQETTRQNLINAANFLRQNYGHNYLATQILEKIKNQQLAKAVVVSIRHPEEVKILKADPNFKLVNIVAPIEMRFARTQKRQGRPEDKDSFEEFKAHEDQERTGSGAGQQLDKVMAMADVVVENTGTIEELKGKIDNLLINSKI